MPSAPSEPEVRPAAKTVFSADLTKAYFVPSADMVPTTASRVNGVYQFCNHGDVDFGLGCTVTACSRCHMKSAEAAAALADPLSPHVNYALRSAQDTRYPTLASKTDEGSFLVWCPNGRPPYGVVSADLILETEGATSYVDLPVAQRSAKPLQHCAHYFFNKVCARGQSCRYIHAIMIKPDAKPGELAPKFTVSDRDRGGEKGKAGSGSGTPIPVIPAAVLGGEKHPAPAAIGPPVQSENSVHLEVTPALSPPTSDDEEINPSRLASNFLSEFTTSGVTTASSVGGIFNSEFTSSGQSFASDLLLELCESGQQNLSAQSSFEVPEPWGAQPVGNTSGTTPPTRSIPSGTKAGARRKSAPKGRRNSSGKPPSPPPGQALAPPRSGLPQPIHSVVVGAGPLPPHPHHSGTPAPVGGNTAPGGSGQGQRSKHATVTGHATMMQ